MVQNLENSRTPRHSPLRYPDDPFHIELVRFRVFLIITSKVPYQMLLHIYFDLRRVAQVIVISFPIQVRNRYYCRPAQVYPTPVLGLIHLLLLNFISGYIRDNFKEK